MFNNVKDYLEGLKGSFDNLKEDLLQKSAKAAADVEYPAYGVTGPNKDVSPTGDRRLAQSAQMYHYQHQKQQIIAMESIIASQFSSRRTQTEHEGRDSYDYRREQASLWGMDPDRTNLSPGREAAERSTYVVGSAERQIAEVLPIESNVDQTLKHEAPRLEKAQKPLKEGFKATEELISKSTDEVPRNEGSITADDKVAIPWETAAASRAVMHASLEPVNPHASERTDSRTSGPAPSPNEDNKLSRIPAERNGSVSEAESEEENEEGDYTVYECPGLAPTGEMEVKNPLFHDDPTPATPAAGPGVCSEAGSSATGTTSTGSSASRLGTASVAATKPTTKDHMNGETKQQKP